MIRIDNLIGYGKFDCKKIYYLLSESHGTKSIRIRRVSIDSYQITYHTEDGNGFPYMEGTFKFQDVESGWGTIIHDTTHPHMCNEYVGVLYEPETEDPEAELDILLTMRELTE